MDFEDIYETDETIASSSGPNVVPPPLPGFIKYSTYIFEYSNIQYSNILML